MISEDRPPEYDYIDVRKAERVTAELKLQMGKIRDLASDDPSAMNLDILTFEVRVAKALREEIDEALGRGPLLQLG